MKKLLSALAVGVVFVVFLAGLWRPNPKAAKFAVGPSLPPGKVAPQLVSSMDTAVLLAPDGSLWAWGGGINSLQGVFAQRTVAASPQRVGSDSDWRSLSASEDFTLALKSDGSLWGWGNDFSGQLARPAPKTYITKPTRIGTETNWTQTSTGAGHCLGLRSDGSLWAWGQNDHGQVGDGTTSNKFTVTRISPDSDWRSVAAGGFNSYALKTNGTVWGWGLDRVFRGTNDTLSPRQTDPGSNWISISASDYALLALKSDGTLWVCGQNAGEYASQYVKASTALLLQIGPDQDWREVHAGWGFFFARKRDGSWWVSGENGQSQLALGNVGYPSSQVAAPQRLGFDFEPWAFATGFRNCVLLTRDGTLWSWGERLGPAASGVSQSSWQEKMKHQWNIIISRFHGRLPLFWEKRPNMDVRPYRLWELPAAMRRSLTTNIPTENEAPTNAASPK